MPWLPGRLGSAWQVYGCHPLAQIHHQPGVTPLAEYAIAEFLASGSYEPYIRRIRRIYERYVGALSQAVHRFFPPECRLTRPGGGFLLWVQLPAAVDSLHLYRQALSAGIAITPGYLFSPTNQYRNFVRLNAANWSDEAEQSIQRLGEMIAALS